MMRSVESLNGGRQHFMRLILYNHRYMTGAVAKSYRRLLGLNDQRSHLLTYLSIILLDRCFVEEGKRSWASSFFEWQKTCYLLKNTLKPVRDTVCQGIHKLFVVPFWILGDVTGLIFNRKQFFEIIICYFVNRCIFKSRQLCLRESHIRVSDVTRKVVSKLSLALITIRWFSDLIVLARIVPKVGDFKLAKMSRTFNLGWCGNIVRRWATVRTHRA